MDTSTIRPGLLVSLKTSVTGGAEYVVRDVEAEHVGEDGVLRARWETEKVIVAPDEYKATQAARSRARLAIRKVCSVTSFGMLCPDDSVNGGLLDGAVAEARRIVEEHNATTQVTKVHLYVIAGRVLQDDVEAARAINAEVRGLLSAMEEGIRKFDPTAVRDAAARAKDIGRMLSPAAADKIKDAVVAARAAARGIVKAGEQVAKEIDLDAIKRITESRTIFLDVEPVAEVVAPAVEGRALDLEPVN
jgi:hypothetical protein